MVAGKIVINEIYPNPDGVDFNNEFIELKNIGGAELDIEGWVIKNTTNIYKVAREDFNITIISAGGFFLLPRSITNIALNNNGDKIEVYSKEEKKIDSVSYNGFAGEGNSYIREDSGRRWTAAITEGNENFFIAPNSAPIAAAEFNGVKEAAIGEEIIFDGSDSFDPDGDSISYLWEISDGAKEEGIIFRKKFFSPGEYKVGLKVTDKFNNFGTVLAKIKVIDNSILDGISLAANESEPMSYKGAYENIFICEALPNPEGADGNNEWIKLCNRENYNINLGGWIIDDKDGGSNPYYIPEDVIIGAKNYFTLSKDKTGIALNNDTDEIRLLSPDGNIKDEVEYKSAKDGEVINFKTETGMDGKVSDALGVNQKVEWGKFKDCEGTGISVEGSVSVRPEILSAQEFYITNGVSGLKVYCFKKDFPELERGDIVSVSGDLKYKDGWQLAVNGADDIAILSYGHPPLARKLKCDSVKKEDVYSLVMVEGDIVKKDGQAIYLDDGTGEIKIYIREATDISGKGMTSGKKLSAIGILDYLNNEFRILPRDQEDLICEDSGEGEISDKAEIITADSDNTYGKVLGAIDEKCDEGLCKAPSDLNLSGSDTSGGRKKLIIYLGITLGALIIIGAILLIRKEI